MTEVKISAKRLKELEEAEETLRALEAGGVDNWEFYEESLSELIAQRDYEEALEAEMDEYLIELSETIGAPAGRDAGYSLCGDEPYEILKRFIKHAEKLKKEFDV